jgi:hypothetical protein
MAFGEIEYMYPLSTEQIDILLARIKKFVKRHSQEGLSRLTFEKCLYVLIVEFFQFECIKCISIFLICMYFRST